MEILVTGGAGYIGSHVILNLIEDGHRVIVVDNLITGRIENIPNKVVFIQGSILDDKVLTKAFSNNIDLVVHLASLKDAGKSMENIEEYSNSNIIGTIKLLNAMINNNVKKIVFSSSAAVYGLPKYLPMDEKHPTKPINYYGYTKLFAEKSLHWYSQLKGLTYASLRYFNAAGYDNKGRVSTVEKNPTNLLPIIMEVANGVRSELKLYGKDYKTDDGTAIRDYIHVSDLANAHCKAIDYLRNKKNIILNLSTGKGYSVLDIIKTARDITDVKIPYSVVNRRLGDPEVLIANSTLANEILDWYPVNSNLTHLIKSMWNVYSNDKVSL
ncbi:MAG: UDP-glucose 4-epimerase GalE [Candidatus Marinimicrobia bacterium]|nr:UDP-glucose 4-epimerase GalE [Candidatus Neomarinimicrobiota bacterium]|tara:strand:+ start:1916 stop:2893 length:978 start_codon:yes stop_codon:yes gene_type:complete